MRILIIRLGAIGDMIGITPLLRYLKQQGNELYILTKKTGKDILANNPNVDKLILYNDELKKTYPDLDEVPSDELGKFFKALEQAYEIDKTINLCESWEVKLGRHPSEPSFKYPKAWAKNHCDINYYEQIFRLSVGYEKWETIPCSEYELFRPEMFFTEAEDIEMYNWFIDFYKIGKKVIMWGLSGSAANKTYPYVPEVVNAILEKYPNVCFLTAGDEVCQILEQELKHERIINRSGIWSVRQSCLATKHADLVIAPDTGLLHASGMYDVYKIGLLNHSSYNNIMKHFKNGYAIEANNLTHPFFGPVSCSPCFCIHYQKKITCNLDFCKHTQAPICMSCLKPEIVIKQIERVLNDSKM